MSIIETVNFSGFCDAFHHMGRAEQFTYSAKRVLFDYLEEYSESCDEPVDLDVIALCCEYSEETADEIASNYDEAPQLDDHDGDEEAHTKAVEEWLSDQTSVCGTTDTGAFVFAQF